MAGPGAAESLRADWQTKRARSQEAAGLNARNQNQLRQRVRRVGEGAQRAANLRSGADGGGGIRATGRATRNAAVGVQLDVSRDGGDTGDGCARGLAGFQRPFIDGRVNLTEVIDAGVLLRFGAGTNEVGNRDCGQKADDGHHNHDLNQRETRPASLFDCLHVFLSLLRGVNDSNRRVYL